MALLHEAQHSFTSFTISQVAGWQLTG